MWPVFMHQNAQLALYIILSLVSFKAYAYPQQLGTNPRVALSENTVTAGLSSTQTTPTTVTPTAAELSGLQDLMTKLGDPVSKNTLLSALARAVHPTANSSSTPKAMPDQSQLASTQLTQPIYLDGNQSQNSTLLTSPIDSADSKSTAHRRVSSLPAWKITQCLMSAILGLSLIGI
ncbi:uncharacterized protein MELLADRAFT_71166 [Melampsora larici-populina 98AG31]|uniref:Secreted protein n=1 Tax=Melampsora larici-populina (strain 98AG31 / pathotype 3-4-7) TaxID=747676 RepID=F4RCW4_MELLP|nr:uncharacterized protein MELLADRAFT_71166 [Melampsora larici-populina 98AG31]EGG09795.1 hypothetical protein MELLADRAFT_71166 [Melampsora larici-populina 98AG31]